MDEHENPLSLERGAETKAVTRADFPKVSMLSWHLGQHLGQQHLGQHLGQQHLGQPNKDVAFHSQLYEHDLN